VLYQTFLVPHAWVIIFHAVTLSVLWLLLVRAPKQTPIILTLWP